MERTSIAIAAAAALWLTPAAAGAQEGLPPAESFELENGLRVVLQPVPGRRHVAVAIRYDVGSRDVPRGYTGLAHLTEHLMFAGTDAYDGAQMVSWLEDAGVVQRNGATTPDFTLYHAVVPAAHLQRALWIEATRMARMLAGLGQERFETQRRVVLHEGRQRGRHGSIGRLQSLLYDHLHFQDEAHPYRRVYEHEEDVQAIRLEHVQRFFQTHYGPDDAVLSLAGGFDPAAARAAVERYFGPIRRSGPRGRRPGAAPVAPLPVERRVTFDAHTQHDELYVLWPTPAYLTEGDADLDVLAYLLAGHRGAPLYRALRTSGLAVDLGVRQHSYELGSYFGIHAVAARGHHTGELLEAIDGALRALQTTPPTPEEVTRACAEWEHRFVLSTESLAFLASHQAVRGPGGAIPTAQWEASRYRSVTPESVQATMRRWLPLDRRLLFFIASNPSAPFEGEVYSVRDVPPGASE